MKIIALVPIKNGEFFLENFKKNVDLVDGFIILNDKCTDNTLDVVKTIHNVLEIVDGFSEYFDDSYNRNRLLNAARKYNPDYVFWIDVDEVWLDFLDIKSVLKKHKPLQLFLPKIHLYDIDTQYIKTYPNSNKGIQWKCRIVKFSEYEDFSFSTKHKLHFPLNPKNEYMKFYPMLIKHYGNFTDELRRFRFEFYLKNDIKKIQSYHHLISKNHKFGNTDDVVSWVKSLNYNWE